MKLPPAVQRRLRDEIVTLLSSLRGRLAITMSRAALRRLIWVEVLDVATTRIFGFSPIDAMADAVDWAFDLAADLLTDGVGSFIDTAISYAGDAASWIIDAVAGSSNAATLSDLRMAVAPRHQRGLVDFDNVPNMDGSSIDRALASSPIPPELSIYEWARQLASTLGVTHTELINFRLTGTPLCLKKGN
jgi:hypothetical protein